MDQNLAFVPSRTSMLSESNVDETSRSKLQPMSVEQSTSSFFDDRDNLPLHLAAHQHNNPKTILQKIRWYTRRIVEHVLLRIFILLLLVSDGILLIVRIAKAGWTLTEPANEPRGYQITSNVFLIIFLVEVSLRLFALGPRVFFSRGWHIFDFSVILTCAILNFGFNYKRLSVLVRLVRLTLLLKFWSERKNLKASTRLLISQNKRRFRDKDFDLDLTYVTERIIAMSFPSSGWTAFYRNPIKEVSKFFNKRHKNHYRIYNLCSERDYDHRPFNDSVSCLYQVDDHNVAPLVKIFEFCEQAHCFLNEDKENIIAVHCKGGKGRTGTMICAYLLYCGMFSSANESLEYFGDRRTDTRVGRMFQGVQTPSQARYVGYIETILHQMQGNLPEKRTVMLSAVIIRGLHNPESLDVTMEIFENKTKLCECGTVSTSNLVRSTTFQQTENYQGAVLRYDFATLLSLSEDIKFKFTSQNLPVGYDHCAFYFWINTRMIQGNSVILPRDVIDNTHKKRRWKYYPENFAIELVFAS